DVRSQAGVERALLIVDANGLLVGFALEAHAAPGEPKRQGQQEIGDGHGNQSVAAKLTEVNGFVAQGGVAIRLRATIPVRRDIDRGSNGGDVFLEVAIMRIDDDDEQERVDGELGPAYVTG